MAYDLKNKSPYDSPYDDEWWQAAFGNEDILDYKNVDLAGDFKPISGSIHKAVKYIEDMRSYKEYMLDVMSNFNGLIWFAVLPYASFVYWNQTRKLNNFKNKHMEYFV